MDILEIIKGRRSIRVFDKKSIPKNIIEELKEAPLVIVACADLTIENYYGKRGSELYALQDVAASIQNLMLLCYERGLGSVWVGAFTEGGISKILNLPSNLRPISIIPIGYPRESPRPPERVRKDTAIEQIQ